MLWNKVQIWLLKVNYFQNLHTDLYKHSLYGFSTVIARGLSLYQVTPVHLVTQESYAWFKLAKERPVKSLNLKRLFIVTPPPTNGAFQEKALPLFLWGLGLVCQCKAASPRPLGLLLCLSVSCIH